MEKNNTEHLYDKYYGPSGYRDNTPEEEICVTDREDEAYWLNLFLSILFRFLNCFCASSNCIALVFNYSSI